LFYVALITIAAMTFLSAGITMTRMTATRIAQTYLAVGYQRAVSSLQQSIAAYVQSGGAANPLPTLTPLPPACAGSRCAFQTSARVTLSPANPAPAATCDASQSNCAQNEQANAYVNEGRIPARIVVTVTTSGGMQLARRSSDVILRTIVTAPYVIIAGARDASFDDVASGHAAGDDGGTVPATPNPCASVAPGMADDTAIRVAYQNTTTAQCTDGSSWRSSSYNTAGSSAPGWSP
jgi:hypothetical protein